MEKSNQSDRVAATVGLVGACVLFGLTIGQMAAFLLSDRPSADWYALSGSAGWLVAGGLMGGAAGAYLARDLSVTARWWSTAVAVVLAAGTLWSIALAA